MNRALCVVSILRPRLLLLPSQPLPPQRAPSWAALTWPLAALQPRAVLGRPACPGLRPPRRSSARAQSACPTAPAPRLTLHGVLSLCGRALALLGSFCFLLPVMAELMLTHRDRYTQTHIHGNTQRERQIHTQTHTHRHTNTDTDTYRHRDTHTQKHTHYSLSWLSGCSHKHTRTRGMGSDGRPPQKQQPASLCAFLRAPLITSGPVTQPCPPGARGARGLRVGQSSPSGLCSSDPRPAPPPSKASRLMSLPGRRSERAPG